MFSARSSRHPAARGAGEDESSASAHGARERRDPSRGSPRPARSLSVRRHWTRPHVSGAAVDTEKLRVALRRMTRDHLLIVAERALEIVPRAKLRQLVGDMVRLEELTEGKPGSASLLVEVRKFHDASLRHEYYESFNVNSKNYMEKSKGTEAFLAEFDRLIGKCVRATAKGPRRLVRDAFELLFALLRRIDEDSDSVVFFADEGGSW